jgi:hypothetical protein
MIRLGTMVGFLMPLSLDFLSALYQLLAGLMPGKTLGDPAQPLLCCCGALPLLANCSRKISPPRRAHPKYDPRLARSDIKVIVCMVRMQVLDYPIQAAEGTINLTTAPRWLCFVIFTRWPFAVSYTRRFMGLSIHRFH